MNRSTGKGRGYWNGAQGKDKDTEGNACDGNVQKNRGEQLLRGTSHMWRRACVLSPRATIFAFCQITDHCIMVHTVVSLAILMREVKMVLAMTCGWVNEGRKEEGREGPALMGCTEAPLL